jgi:TPR repeat protein
MPILAEVCVKTLFSMLALLFLLSSGARALEQEEVFTDLVPGQDMLDPENLARLLEKNDVRAMNNAGLLWAKGYQGKQSYSEAMQWWKEAARRGYTVAMNNLGLMYANGHGVTQDYAEAFKWWHQSAFLGNAWAMNNVGDLYENGLGVERNLIMAMTWYKSAAEQGEPMGMYNVGLLYEAGQGVERDDVEALEWFRKSAAKGYASAMHAIGTLYREGRAVAADPEEALAWYTAAQKRYPPEDAAEAKRNSVDIDNLSSQLDAAQLERVKARAAVIEAQNTPVKPEPPKPLKPGEKST